MLEEVAVVMSMLVLNDSSGPYDSEILGTSSKVFADKIWRFSNFTVILHSKLFKLIFMVRFIKIWSGFGRLKREQPQGWS